MDQYIGKLLDNRYELLELIGSGGMAKVYKARCHRLNRLVAVKILREDMAQDAEFRRRFHDESQAVAMLSHPNIMAVYDVSRSSELEYIVMELLDGITLSGGDPICQPEACLVLARAAHESRLNVWAYTGYTWEALLKENDPARMALLQEIDVLVDGPFVLAQKSLELKFCGSRNQRLIDVKKSFVAGEAVLWQPPTWDVL